MLYDVIMVKSHELVQLRNFRTTVIFFRMTDKKSSNFLIVFVMENVTNHY